MMKLDQGKLSHRLLIAGMVGMVMDDGLTPHQVLEVLEDAKKELFHALAEIYRERRSLDS